MHPPRANPHKPQDAGLWRRGTSRPWGIGSRRGNVGSKDTGRCSSRALQGALLPCAGHRGGLLPLPPFRCSHTKSLDLGARAGQKAMQPPSHSLGVGRRYKPLSCPAHFCHSPDPKQLPAGERAGAAARGSRPAPGPLGSRRSIAGTPRRCTHEAAGA